MTRNLLIADCNLKASAELFQVNDMKLLDLFLYFSSPKKNSVATFVVDGRMCLAIFFHTAETDLTLYI